MKTVIECLGVLILRHSRACLFTPDINQSWCHSAFVGVVLSAKERICRIAWHCTVNLARWLDASWEAIKFLTLAQRLPCSRPRWRSTRSKSSFN